ncbi:MAG TPA: hypothetical protein VD862_03555 [Candidatus Paceibacterota bacterium]|nr:hypothetical protein [Candidatus Paceibacterota bacterium]
MTTEKILSVVGMYRRRMEAEGIPKRRMDPARYFGSQTRRDLLAHAHFLLDGVEEYAKDTERAGKTGRHLGSVQTLLSVCGWYTLQELMDHNRPDGTAKEG